MLPFNILSAVLLALAATAQPLDKRAPLDLPITVARSQPNFAARSSDAELEFTSTRVYTVPVSIGTPAVTTNLLLDAGSTVMWVIDSNSTAGQYSSAKSSTWKVQKDSAGKDVPFRIDYRAGTVTGVFGHDTVVIGGQTIDQQQFGSAVDGGELERFIEGNTSGIVGLGWPKPGSGTEKPFWQRLVDGWSDKQFGVYLNRARTEDGSNAGTLTLGGTNSAHYTGALTYTPRLNLRTLEEQWTVRLDGINVNGKEVARPGIPAVLDTGAELSFGPKEDIAAFYAQIPGSEAVELDQRIQYLVPCDTTAKVSLSIGGISYDIHPEDIVGGGYNIMSDKCIGGFIATPGYSYWLLGNTFLQNVYQAYRYDPPSVGLAKLKA